tara:strand:- start:385 stop:2283 length:1899 start_codon:yes stop_codon:yes gene_type:complete
MPIAKVKLEDGRIARFEVPEGTTEAQVLQFAEENKAQFDLPLTEQQAPIDAAATQPEAQDVSFGEGLSEGFERGLKKMIGGLTQKGFQSLMPSMESSLNQLKTDVANNAVPDSEIVRTLQRIEQLESAVGEGKKRLVGAEAEETQSRKDFERISEGAPISSFIGEAGGQLAGGSMLLPVGAAIPATTIGKMTAGGVAGAASGFAQPTIKEEDPLDAAKVGGALGATLPFVAGKVVAPIAGAAIAPVKQKLFNYFGKLSPKQQKIIDAINLNPRDPDFAKFDVVEGIPKQNAAFKMAIKQSGSPELVSVMTAASKTDKAAFKNMLNIIKQGKRDPLFADRVRVGHVVGKSLSERLGALKELNSQAGKEIDKVARRALKGKSIDVSEAKQSFKNKLEGLRVNYNPATGAVSYKGSALEGEGGGQARDLITRLANNFKSDSIDASDAHFAKRLIDQKVSFGKSDGGFTGEIDRAIKGFRSDINSTIGQNFPKYAAANKKYSTTVSAIDNYQDTVGKKVNLDSANALGVSSRGFTNNTIKRDNLLGSLEEIQGVLAENGVKFKDDILTQVNITNALEKRFKTQGSTTLDASVAKGVGQAVTKSKVELAVDLVGSAVDKVSGVTDDKAIEALLRITE